MASLCRFTTFVFADIDTADHFFVEKNPGIAFHFRKLHLSPNFDHGDRWNRTFHQLGKLTGLTRVYMWIYAILPRHIRFALERQSYCDGMFPGHLAKVAILNIPYHPRNLA